MLNGFQFCVMKYLMVQVNSRYLLFVDRSGIIKEEFVGFFFYRGKDNWRSIDSSD